MHFFDPDRDQYVEKIISIPGISVLGGVAQEDAKSDSNKENLAVSDKGGTPATIAQKRFLLAPIFSPRLGHLAFEWLDYLNIVLVSLLILLPGHWWARKYIEERKRNCIF